MGVLNLPFFPFLNLTGIFVCIGIGADDVFVFIDAWKQSAIIMGKETDLAERMSFVLHRACGSMFITSVTTGMAFLSNFSNQITALKCFGVYCAIMIFVDFVSMLSYIPATVIIYEKYVRNNPWCCGFCGGCCSCCEVPKGEGEVSER